MTTDYTDLADGRKDGVSEAVSKWVCEECKRQGREIRIKHLDFDRQAETFIVHSQFKAAINAGSPTATKERQLAKQIDSGINAK